MQILMGKKRRDELLNSNEKLCKLISPYTMFYTKSEIMGNTVIQPLDNIWINDEIYVERVYDRFIEISNDSVVIDVGAHVDLFTLRAARKARKGIIFAIEPHPINYKFLNMNVKINKITNIKTLKLALSNINGVEKLFLGHSTGHSLHFIRPDGSLRSDYVEVQTKTLDVVVKELGVSSVDFIKIDAEGAKLEILHGAEETLRINDLFLSIAAYHYETEIQEISDFLHKLGFKVFTYKDYYVYASKPETNLKHHLGTLYARAKHRDEGYEAHRSMC